MADPAKGPIPKTITDEAAHWLSESFDDALPPDQRARLDAWLAADPRHREAFEEIQQVWTHLDAVQETPALRASVTPVARHRSVWRRRRRPMDRGRRWIPAAAAACLALAFIGMMDDWPTRLRADAITATGERRALTLPDGSKVQLDTQSAVAFDFTPDRRVVRLLKGQAAFSVAHVPGRPFTVEAGDGSTTALGTKFLVRREGEDTRVIVTEHRVRIACPTENGRTAIVAEGNSASYGPGRAIGPIARINPTDAMAWTEGVAVFKDAPLTEVTAAIGRYHPGYIRVIGDVRGLRVSGVFRFDDPVAAINQLQRSLNLRSVRFTDRVIFIFA